MRDANKLMPVCEVNRKIDSVKCTCEILVVQDAENVDECNKLWKFYEFSSVHSFKCFQKLLDSNTHTHTDRMVKYLLKFYVSDKQWRKWTQ